MPKSNWMFAKVANGFKQGGTTNSQCISASPAFDAAFIRSVAFVLIKSTGRSILYGWRLYKWNAVENCHIVDVALDRILSKMQTLNDFWICVRACILGCHECSSQHPMHQLCPALRYNVLVK